MLDMDKKQQNKWTHQASKQVATTGLDRFAARPKGQGRARGRLGTAGRIENAACVRRPDLKCRERLQDEIEGLDRVSRRKGPSAWLSSESDLGVSTMRISPAARLSA
jgi:hypothetical protein